MTTVLLWGNRWWLPHHPLPIPFSHPAQAADQLAAAWSDPNRTIRLIYQPDDLDSVPVQCPNGNRSTLTCALAEDHPVMVHPGHVWSYEPILPMGDGFGTLLHYEATPGLYALVHRLREHGFTISSVWPMITWLNGLPPDLSPSGAMTICALHTDRFCLYRQSTGGTRAFRAGHSGDILKAVSSHLADLPTHVETEFVLFVSTDDALVESLITQIPVDDRQILGVLSLTGSLAKAVPLGPKHPAQLLPPVPVITAPKLLSVISGACLLIALGLSVTPAINWWNQQANRRAQAQEKQTLLATVGTDAIDPLPWDQFVSRLTTSLPAEVVLTTIQADRQGFELDGGIANGSSGANLALWQQSLQGQGAPWNLAAETYGASAFKVKGRWQ
ncbi:MAG: hypothetical protein H7A44_08465 [Opitutaceae bacterium]|nr:hypothetical protein [Cephaloticoccus sp.]MCP5530463.1 hypothetical protein [Opitutaceae bacterium]